MVRRANGFSRSMQHQILKKMSVLIATSVYQAAGHAIVPGCDANREATTTRIPRSDKGSKSCPEAQEDTPSATMLSNAWTGHSASETRRVLTEQSVLSGKQKPRFQSKPRA